MIARHERPRHHLEQPVSLKSRAKIPLLYVGDIIIFYAALTLTLFLRYQELDTNGTIFQVHVQAFTIALFAWLFIFYVGGMYERQMFNPDVLKERFFPLLGIGGIVLILLFYFVPSFDIAPKTNLFIFIAIYAALGYSWRISFNSLLRLRAGLTSNRVMLIGDNTAAQEVQEHLSKHPQLGYEVVLWLREGLRTDDRSPEEFSRFVVEKGINMVAVPNHLEHDPGALRMLYYAFTSGIEVTSLSDFYERLFDRVAIVELEDSWLLKNLPRVAKRQRRMRYLLEAFVALVLFIGFLPFMITSALAIAFTSPGPIIYKQVRVGRNERPFWLYKFRTMSASKEKNPDADAGVPTWSTSNDHRVTPIGNFLRASHFDELPQLINVLRGEMSFVGPRPERPEFTSELEAKIPYYELRYLLNPGITGWAQINYRYGASVEDAYQKLQYEIYYLKNRSLFLDLAIVAKTLKRFFVSAR